MREFIENYIKDSVYTKQKLLADSEKLSVIENAADLIINTYKNNGKVLIAGNGGSAADAQHIATEFVLQSCVDGTAKEYTHLLNYIESQISGGKKITKQTIVNGYSNQYYLGKLYEQDRSAFMTLINSYWDNIFSNWKYKNLIEEVNSSNSSTENLSSKLKIEQLINGNVDNSLLINEWDYSKNIPDIIRTVRTQLGKDITVDDLRLCNDVDSY